MSTNVARHDFDPELDLVLEDGVPLESWYHRLQMVLFIELARYRMLELGHRDFFLNGDMFCYYSPEQAQEVAEEERQLVLFEQGLRPDQPKKIAYRGPDVMLVKDVPKDKHQDLDFIIEQLDWEKNCDPYFKKNHYLEPIVDQSRSGVGYTDRWIDFGTFDGKQLFSAKELTIEPGAKCTLQDPGASGWITVQGSGRMGALELQTPVMIHFGEEPWDEVYLVSAMGGDGGLAEASLHSRAELVHWWSTLELGLIADPALAQRKPLVVEIELKFVPFSQNEQRDAKLWIERSLDGPLRATPDGQLRSDPNSRALSVLVATSIKRRAILQYDWEVAVRQEQSGETENGPE